MLNSLGLILLNSSEAICRHPIVKSKVEEFEGSIFEQSKIAEREISKDERIKAKALEAIIAYDTIAKARESKEAIQKEIDALNKRIPMAKEVKDASMFKEMLDRMAQLDMQRNPNTKKGMWELLDALHNYYKDAGTYGHPDYHLPIYINELRAVYNELSLQDGTIDTEL